MLKQNSKSKGAALSPSTHLQVELLHVGQALEARGRDVLEGVLLQVEELETLQVLERLIANHFDAVLVEVQPFQGAEALERVGRDDLARAGNSLEGRIVSVVVVEVPQALWTSSPEHLRKSTVCTELSHNCLLKCMLYC